MDYWIFKTEPDEFSIQDLETQFPNPEMWNGIRNYKARNYLRDEVKLGDLVLIYHSSCKKIGITGLASVTKTAYPDPTAFDKDSDYYDPKSLEDDPKWFCVDIKWEKTLSHLIPPKELKGHKLLKEIELFKIPRLSISKLSKSEFEFIMSLRKA